MGKALAAAAAVFAGLSFGVAASAEELVSAPCQQVVGQAEIGGVLQEISGVACLQPGGTWQLVDGASGAVTYAAPAYYYDPWYWAPVGVGFGGSVIFVDRFHHFHHMHHVFFRRPGVIVRGGFHNGFHGGFHRGFHNGGRARGGFHGGGMHH
ncbi:hypothetical protein [Cupriavidus sp. DF5525]|uniref:hypothetical protein n=1 Tax=Cupriavidus sp. DF5525 TaxID=3160989 RepID=UPI0032DFD920